MRKIIIKIVLIFQYLLPCIHLFTTINNTILKKKKKNLFMLIAI
jgi:hypothetical protein